MDYAKTIVNGKSMVHIGMCKCNLDVYSIYRCCTTQMFGLVKLGNKYKEGANIAKSQFRLVIINRLIFSLYRIA